MNHGDQGKSKLNRTSIVLIFTFWLSLMGLACTKKTSSGDVRTSGFVAHYTVVGDPGDLDVSCQAYFTLESDGSNYLNLSDGDTVTCNGEAMSKTGDIYFATPTYAVGGTYTIILTRTGESPYEATVTMPTAPASPSPSGINATKGQPLTATWTASGTLGDEVVVVLDNNHTGSDTVYSTATDTSPEAGSVTFGTSETEASNHAAGTWGSDLKFTRRRPGTMPTGLAGSIIATNFSATTLNLID